MKKEEIEVNGIYWTTSHSIESEPYLGQNYPPDKPYKVKVSKITDRLVFAHVFHEENGQMDFDSNATICIKEYRGECNPLWKTQEEATKAYEDSTRHYALGLIKEGQEILRDLDN